jgi:hypothetical protein
MTWTKDWDNDEFKNVGIKYIVFNIIIISKLIIFAKLQGLSYSNRFVIHQVMQVVSRVTVGS